MRRLILTAIACACALVSPATADAVQQVGVTGDEAEMFSSRPWTDLGLRHVRHVVPWDVADRPEELALSDRFMAAADAAGMEVLLHIGAAISTGAIPSAAEYRRRLSAILARYPRVRTLGVWATANGRGNLVDPARAVEYFRAARSLCPRCELVALDLLDDGNAPTYARGWFSALGRTSVAKAVVGVQNLEEVNRSRAGFVTSVARLVASKRRAMRLWITQSGGVVRHRTSSSEMFPCDVERAARATQESFDVLRANAALVDRMYLVDWRGDCGEVFDGGLVAADGTPRPGFSVVQENLRHPERITAPDASVVLTRLRARVWRVDELRVRAPRGSRIEFSCAGTPCGGSLRRTRRTRTVLRQVRGTRLGRGDRMTVRVVTPGGDRYAATFANVGKYPTKNEQ